MKKIAQVLNDKGHALDWVNNVLRYDPVHRRTVTPQERADGIKVYRVYDYLRLNHPYYRYKLNVTWLERRAFNLRSRAMNLEINDTENAGYVDAQTQDIITELYDEARFIKELISEIQAMNK